MVMTVAALVGLNTGCSAEVVDGGTEPAITANTRALGERCWTSGAPPCAEGLACLPDPAFANIPGEPAPAPVRTHSTLAMIAPSQDTSGSDPFAGDPGARPWICQPSP